MRLFPILIFILFLSNSLLSQSYYQKTYGGSATETGTVVDLTSDGGYMIAGTTNSFGSGSNDIFLVKLDASGDTLWTKAVGTGGSETGAWLEQTADNGYIITGTNGSLYLNKVDASGISVWAKSYGGSSNDEGTSVQQTPDNGYIVAGLTSSSGAGAIDVFLIKTNTNGDTAWTKTYGGSANDRGYSVDQTSDGGYIVCGQTNSFGAGGSDAYLVKVNSTGMVQWSKAYGGSADDEGRSVAQTSDGGYIVTGTTASFGAGGEDIFTFKTDGSGVVQWSKTFGEFDGDDNSNCIVQTTDGGYVLTGSTTSYGSSTVVAYLLKLNGAGNPEWANPEKKIFGGNSGSDIGNSVRQTADGGYIFVATSTSYGAGGSDIYLVRSNSIGDSSSTCGTGAVSPQVGNPSNAEASATTVEGSGANVANVSAVSLSINTATTKLPLGVLITTTSVSCFGDTDGQAVATVSAGSPPYTYSWSIGSSTTSANTGLPPGTWALSVIDNFSCVQTDSFTITEPGELLISFTVDTIAGCGGGSNGVITGSITGGTPPYNYNWSNGDNLSNTTYTSHTINGLAAGSYSLNVTDANGCMAIDTIKSGMTFTSGGTDANCSTANGSAWIGVSGGNTPYTFLWNNPGSQTTDTASGLSPGVYTVWVTDSNGCSDSASITVNSLFGGPIVTVDSVVDIDCYGAGNGEIYMTITDGPFGLPPYSILWSNTATTDDITGLNGGTYTVEVTETSTGCVTSAVAAVSEPSSALTVTITDSSDITCFGAADGSATLSASGGTAPFIYGWTPTGGTGTVANGLAASTYTATVLDANGCTAFNTVSIAEPSAIALSTDTSGESCLGGDGQAWVTASGGVGSFTYLWDDVGTQATDTAFNLIAGVYTITVTDNNGCTNTAIATIVQTGNPPVITTDSTNNVRCNGGADGSIYITISGGTGPYTYSWSPGMQNTDDITGLSAGTNTVTVMDNTGCTATNIITITEPGVLGISIAGTDISCSGASDGSAVVTASIGTGPYTYLWSTSGTSSSVTGLAAGFSTVTVTDNCGAALNDSVNIADPAGVTISNEVSVGITCFGANDGTITITASGGTNPLAYSIDGGATFTNSTGIFTGLASNTYTVVVQDSNFCQTTGSVLAISEPPALSIDSELATDVLGCSGNMNGTITLTGNGGNGPLTYSIDTTNYQVGGSFTGLAAGTYTVGIQDSAGCQLLGSTLTINEPTMVVIDSELMVDISCTGAADGTITIVASGGTGSYFYSIDGGTTLVNTTGVFTGLPAGSYDVFLIDTDTCVAQGSTFTLTDPPGISITSETKTDIDCPGDADGTIDIVATGGTAPLTYSIDTVDFTNTTGNFTNLDTGTYYIMVQDSNGCIQMGSTLVITAPATAITLTDSVVGVTGCSGNSNGAIFLTGTGGSGSLAYSIDGGTTFDNGGGIFANLAGGSYDLAAQDDNGCILLGAIVTVSELPLLLVVEQSSSDPAKGNCDGSITVMASGGTPNYTYLWDDTANQTNSSATNLCGGDYIVLVTDANGCTSTLTITLLSPDNDIFIPTAFSPNGDNENDKLLVRGSYAAITMVVYNRWGEKIFETKVKDHGWDGTQNGTNAPSDSYGYYIELVMTDGSTQVYKGDILLVR